MAITDYIPNVFGQATPSYLPGLLGAEETKNLQNRANVQGLLGAGLALAQGMSNVGPRRSAAENILGALAGGFGAAGGAYEQGIKNYVTQQQIAQTQLAQTQAANKLKSIAEAKAKYPDLAPLADIDSGKFAEEVALRERLKGIGGTQGAAQMPTQTPDALRAQAQRAYTAGPNFKALGDSFMEQANRLEVEMAGRGNVPAVPTAATQPQVAPTEVPVITGEEKALPGITVTAQQGPDAQLLAQKNQLLEVNRNLFKVPTKEAREQRKANEESISKIDEQLKQISSATFNWVNIEKEVPEKFKPQIRNLRTLADTGYLGLDQIRLGIQDVYKQVQESEKGAKIEGLPGIYAQQKFGTANQTQLKPDQLSEVLRFADAPTADQYAQLAREAQRTQFETGTRPPVPAPRSTLINARSQVTPQVTTQAQPQIQTQVPTQVQPSPQQQVVPTADQTVAPTPRAQTRTSSVIDLKVAQNPLISQPDSKVPPKKKQELIQAQPGLIAASNYTLKNIVDARNAAQSLLDNPAYIEALSGRTAPLRTQTVGGIVLDQQAYSANEILNNILGRSFISEIQEMRANSPTGGAVGNVAVAEMESLSKIRGAFKVGMDKAELKKQLESYISNANRALKTIPNDYARTYGYNGEFDELLTSEVVKPTATQNKPPKGVTVRRAQ
jgi:hypothetical protein